MSCGIHLFGGQKVQGQGHESTSVDPYTLVSASFFWFQLLLLHFRLYVGLSVVCHRENVSVHCTADSFMT